MPTGSVMPDRRILLTGGSGVLGSAIQPLLRDEQVWAPTRVELNVSVSNDWADGIENFTPTEIWHFAAETPSNSDARWYLDVNILGTAYAAMFCQMNGIRLVYTSTDYVFGLSGDAQAPYDELAGMQPWNDYAWSKLGGEAAVRMVEDHLIIRGSWYGEDTFEGWEYAATDNRTSKYYVNLAARDITALALSGFQGTIHVGMTVARTLYNIVHITENEPKRGLSADLGVPKTTALDTSLCQSLLKSLPDQQSTTV